MINIDLSKMPSLRFLTYLLSLFPGLFFLLSVAIADPASSKPIITEIESLYSVPPYGLLVMLLGAGFVCGHAITTLAWFLEMLLVSTYLFIRRVLRSLLRWTLAGQKVYEWFSKYQGIPPRRNLFVRNLGRLIMLARTLHETPDSPDLQAVRWCLHAAVEKVIQRQFELDPRPTNGGTGREWRVWSVVIGKRLPYLQESSIAGRMTLATGLAGFIAINTAPMLMNRYYLSLCSILAFSGLWTRGWFFIQSRSPLKRDLLCLREALHALGAMPPIISKVPSEAKPHSN
jgi:hypothetical protein